MTEPRPRRAALVTTIAIVSVGVLVAAVVFFATRGSGGTSAGGRKPLRGFSTTHVTVAKPASSLEWCLLLAETEVQRERGLMQVTDPTLGGYDGMLFRFDTDTTATFYMRNTPMPLSIAFVASDGHVVSTGDMAPCEDRDGCPLYEAAGPYRVAIEVPQGRLEQLGIDTDAVVTYDARRC